MNASHAHFSLLYISEPLSFLRWREITCFAVEDVSWLQFNSWILRTPFASIITWNNWEVMAETRSFCDTGVVLCQLSYQANWELVNMSVRSRRAIYIYIYITNCRQYCFGLLGLISAVLMLRWRWSLKSHLELLTNVVTQSCQSARTRVL